MPSDYEPTRKMVRGLLRQFVKDEPAGIRKLKGEMTPPVPTLAQNQTQLRAILRDLLAVKRMKELVPTRNVGPLFKQAQEGMLNVSRQQLRKGAWQGTMGPLQQSEQGIVGILSQLRGETPPVNQGMAQMVQGVQNLPDSQRYRGFVKATAEQQMLTQEMTRVREMFRRVSRAIAKGKMTPALLLLLLPALLGGMGGRESNA